METTLRKQPRLYLSEKTKEIIVDCICYAFIILFVYTASSKLQDYNTFQSGLHNSVLLKPYSATLAWLIPAAEIFISVFLIIPKTRRQGLVSSLLIMIAFTSYLIYMVSYGGPKTCGCGGVIQSLTWVQHIWFNITFIFLASIALLCNSMKKSNRS